MGTPDEPPRGLGFTDEAPEALQLGFEGALVPRPDGIQIPIGPPPEFPREGEGQTYIVTDVTAFGAIGDGRDVTRAVEDAIRETPDGGVIYFPHGFYDFEVIVDGRSCLTFVGDGPCSTLRWEGGGPILLFQSCTDITMTRLAINGRGFRAARDGRADGLVVADSCTGFRITQTRWRDSEPGDFPDGAGALAPQRPGFRVVGRLSVCEDIWFHDNFMDRYGVAMHNVKRGRIAANTIRFASGHGVWVGSNDREESIVEDFEIVDNTIEDPIFHGVALADRGREVVVNNRVERLVSGSSVQRVRIVRNRITKAADAEGDEGWSGIFVGAHPDVAAEDGRVTASNYRDICVEANFCESAKPERPDVSDDTGIHFTLPVARRTRDDQSELRSDPAFERAVVRGNTIRGFFGDGILLEQMRFSAVGDNAIRECGRGLVLDGNVFQNHVHRNRVLDIRGQEYVLSNSLGLNVLNGDVRLSDDGRAHWQHEPDEERDHFFGTDEAGE